MLYYLLMLFCIYILFKGGICIKSIYDDKVVALQKVNPKINFKDIIYIIFTFMKLLVKQFIIKIVQTYITSFCITKVKLNTYDVILSLQNKLIKIRIKLMTGPGSILQILDKDSDIDLTDQILPYLNYTVEEVTCEDLGYKNIEYYISSGDIIEITTKDSIKLKKD